MSWVSFLKPLRIEKRDIGHERNPLQTLRILKGFANYFSPLRILSIFLNTVPKVLAMTGASIDVPLNFPENKVSAS